MAILTVCLFSFFSVSAQEKVDSLVIYFRQGYSIYEPNFENNGKRMEEFISRVKEIQTDSLFKIVSVSYVSAASPEGISTRNEILAKKRATTISSYLHQHISFADSAIESVLRTEDYPELIKMVEASDMPYRDEVLEILRTYPTEEMVNGVLHNPCKLALINLKGGEAWNYMLKHFFPYLRRFKMFVVISRDNSVDTEKIIATEPAPVVEKLVPTPTPEPTPIVTEPASTTTPEPTPVVTEPAPTTIPEPTPIVTEPTHTVTPEPVVEVAKQGWNPQMLIKTNLVGWGMAVTNLAIEVELAKHFSFNLPVYYSGFDYFKDTYKYRTFAIYPEFRVWLKERDGLFIGAHGGLAYFNVAYGGDWRIQDKDGTTPALGGGLNFGYRLPLSKKHPRWKVEFTIGAGVYDVHYEKFVNEKDGPKAQGSVHDTVIALDNVGISFSYSIDLKKRNK